jgi:hypothetical protein
VVLISCGILLSMPISDQGVTTDRCTSILRTAMFLRSRDVYLPLYEAATKCFPGKHNELGGHIERGEELHRRRTLMAASSIAGRTPSILDSAFEGEP